MSPRLAGIALCSWLWFATPGARADPMDLALERLVSNASSCASADGVGRFQPAGASTRCQPDQVAFKRLVSQLGFALAPTATNATRATGFGGFSVGLEVTFTSITADADYWRRGTQGTPDPVTKRAALVNQDPASVLQQYALKLRKGFGFGLEVSAVMGVLPHTSLINAGADVRLALLEGFRRGLLGVLPDISVGAGVRSIAGTPELDLTTVGIDTQVSKPFVIRESSRLTPWLGYQYIWIFGDSGSIDLTPGTSAIGACNYGGQNSPGNADPKKTFTDPAGNIHDVYDGQPICKGGSARDFDNDVVFNPVRLHRQRLIFGLDWREEMWILGGQFSTDLFKPADENSGANEADLKGEDRQWTLALELGATF